MARQEQKIFISYSHKDIEYANALDEILQREGWSTWRDVHEIFANENWQDKIYSGLEASACFILLWSRNCATSEWATGEDKIRSFLKKKKKNNNNKNALCVLLDDHMLPDTYHDFQCPNLHSWQPDGKALPSDPEPRRVLTELLDWVSATMLLSCPETTKKTQLLKARHGTCSMDRVNLETKSCTDYEIDLQAVDEIEKVSRLASYILPKQDCTHPEKALENLLDLIRKSHGRSFKLYGSSGTGKTFILSWIYRLALDGFRKQFPPGSGKRADTQPADAAVERALFPVLFDLHDYDDRIDPEGAAERDLRNLVEFVQREVKKEVRRGSKHSEKSPGNHPEDPRILILVDGFDEPVGWREGVENVFLDFLGDMIENPLFHFMVAVSSGVDPLNIESAAQVRYIHIPSCITVNVSGQGTEKKNWKRLLEFQDAFRVVSASAKSSDDAKNPISGAGLGEHPDRIADLRGSSVSLRDLAMVDVWGKYFCEIESSSVFYYHFCRKYLLHHAPTKVKFEEDLDKLTTWAYQYFVEPAEGVEIGKSTAREPTWQLIHYSPDFRDYLIASRILRDFLGDPGAVCGDHALKSFYNSAIMRHCIRIMNRNPKIQERAVQNAEVALRSSDPHVISNICFLLGRLADDSAIRNAHNVLARQRAVFEEAIKERKNTADIYLVALRTIFISLIYGGGSRCVVNLPGSFDFRSGLESHQPSLLPGLLQ